MGLHVAGNGPLSNGDIYNPHGVHIAAAHDCAHTTVAVPAFARWIRLRRPPKASYAPQAVGGAGWARARKAPYTMAGA